MMSTYNAIQTHTYMTSVDVDNLTLIGFDGAPVAANDGRCAGLTLAPEKANRPINTMIDGWASMPYNGAIVVGTKVIAAAGGKSVLPAPENAANPIGYALDAPSGATVAIKFKFG